MTRPLQSINPLNQIPNINERLGQDLTTMLCNRMVQASFPDSPSEQAYFSDTWREGVAWTVHDALSANPNATLIDVWKLLCGEDLEDKGQPI